MDNSSNKPLKSFYSQQALNTLQQNMAAGLGGLGASTASYPISQASYSWPPGITMEPCYPVDYSLPLNIKLKDGTIKSVPWQEVMQSLGIEW